MCVRVTRFVLMVLLVSLQGLCAEETRILMVTQSVGYRHASVTREKEQLATAEVAMIQLGQQSGLFTVDCTQDAAADFTQENLQNYQIVVFYTTGALPIEQSDLDYFFNTWLKTKGNGVIGFHSAADTFGDYEPYWDMIGGTFKAHPWNSGDTVTISVHEPDHSLMKPFGKEIQIRDEIYEYRHWQPEKVRVLMSLDMEKCEKKKPYHVPVAWVKSYGEGRVYYNNLGHNRETWSNNAYLDSIAAGVKWIRISGDAASSPNPEVSAAQEVVARQAVDE
ncbi:MAG: ThuA domain-containing protein [Fuerstiella sp.]|nr:ThuA domain-containing protein [Fuerstiella sp.]